MTTLNGQLASLDAVLARLTRLEQAAGLLAAVATRQALPSEYRAALELFAHAVAAEHRARETAAHLPEPDL